MQSALGTDNSPFSEQQLVDLKRVLATLEPHQSLWLSGFLAGRAQLDRADDAAVAGETLRIYYGSETGNGEALATALHETARSAGIAAELASLDGLRPATLARDTAAVFIVSTHGEGDPPEEAMDLFQALTGSRAPRLEQLRFRVLALGDRSYAEFCAAGRTLDERLEALGATRIAERIDCDVDYQALFQAWSSEVIGWAHDELAGPGAAAPPHLSLVPETPAWTRTTPFEAELLERRRITAPESERDVHHLELSLAGSGLHYAPGDALGVWAPNQPATVDRVLSALDLDGNAPVVVDEEPLALRTALTEHRELTRILPETVKAYAKATGLDALRLQFEGLTPAQRRDYLEARQFAALLNDFPGQLEAQALVDLLPPLTPRSYSIASSEALLGEEVHLTVSTVDGRYGEQAQAGVASHHLNQHLQAGASVRVFLEPNSRFRLPDDPTAPLIMIGAGTGVAPYRSFLQELEARGEQRQGWLIFGNPHRRTDFLYQREWLRWRERGLVTRIDAAWSRDQEEKRYVQHLVQEQSARLVDWIDQGAHLYLCGALAMGQAVQDAIRDSLARERQLTPEAAAEALAALRRAGRLHRDLY